jgi:anti-sigma factor RsiW
MPDCSEIALLLGPFEDGELEPHEMQDVARHLAQCISCEGALREMTELGRALRASVVTPSLDGFAAAVQSRIAEVHVPWRQRISNTLQDFGERWMASAMMAGVAGAVAVLVALLATPYVRSHFGGASNPAIASAPAQSSATIAQGPQRAQSAEQVASSPDSAPVGFTDDPISSRAVIDKLESEESPVAVWSEPQNDTTVIWLPDQQQ